MNYPFTFQEICDYIGSSVEPFDKAPKEPGYYLLFTEDGIFIYVGKASDLNYRITYHFSKDETNERIRDNVKYVAWFITSSVNEAERKEGEIYDNWVRSTGMPPFANKVKPPGSMLTESESLSAVIRSLFCRS